MKKMIRAGLMGLLLLTAALGLGGYGYYQVILSRAQEHTDKLEYGLAEKIYHDFEKERSWWLRLPWAGEIVKRQVNGKKRALRYWQGQYTELVQQAKSGSDPETTAVHGHAFYRVAENETNPQKVLVFLDAALQIYTRVIKSEPDGFDPVYNYEYLHRVREEVAKGKRSLPLKDPGQKKPGNQATKGEEPGQAKGKGEGRANIHGQPGTSPSVAGQSDKIKIYAPTNSEEEAKKGPGAGKENVQRKKG